jgi:hypothetical protein
MDVMAAFRSLPMKIHCVEFSWRSPSLTQFGNLRKEFMGRRQNHTPTARAAMAF